MKLTIFGATGGTGKHLVRQALDAGHEVTAVVRDPSRLDVNDPRMHVEQRDVFDVAAITPTVEGRDAVVSALGSGDRAPTTVHTDGARSIMQAMRAGGVRRFVAVSAAGHTTEASDPLTMRLAQLFLKRFLKHPYADMVRMEKEIRASDLDWTIVRPPKLENRPHTGRYRTAINQHVQRYTIGRADLADGILRMLDDEQTVRAMVGIAS